MAMQILGSPYLLIFAIPILFLENSAKVEADCSNTPIGLENKFVIPDSSFTASSYFNVKYKPSNARLNGYNGWGPGIPRGPNEYLEVDLGYPNVICAIATQGGSVNEEWVTQYKIATSFDGTKWTDYKENGDHEVKLFTGNTDSNTIVKNTVQKVLARYVRIFPTEYKTWLTMRVGLFGYPGACDNFPLGMESKAIQNIAASSDQSSVNNARLHYTSGRSWCASTSDSNPYLQIDLGSSHLICAVATQGNSKAAEWVKTYQIDTSTDGTTWATYQENNTDRVFTGNFDGSSVVREVMFYGTVTRYIRILPKEKQTKACLRTEIYGYRVNPSCSSHSLGIPSSKLIPDYRFTATSFFNNDHQPFMARLGSNTTWGPALKNDDDYLQIDIGALSFICSISTQGNGNKNLFEWVTQYKVLYSTTDDQWITYRENGTEKEFSGNTDQSTVVTNSIKNLFQAKFIRIFPTGQNRWKSMRVDFKGLPAACVSSLGLENSYLPDNKINSSSNTDSSHTAAHGRLYGGSSWCISSSSSTKHIQVDFGEVKTVTGIGTQGDKNLKRWVTTYEMEFSFDIRNWYKYKEGQVVKVFDGNKNNIGVIVNWLSHPIAARYVRILPQTSIGGFCLRLDLYGCTYYIPEIPSNPVTPDKRSAVLKWTDMQTHEGTANLFWITVSNKTGQIQRFSVRKETNNWEIKNLKPYTKYEVKIIAEMAYGRPLWQSTWKFETLIAVPEGSPTIETVIATSSQSLAVTFKFTQKDKLNGPLAGYRIFYTPEGGTQQSVDVGIVITKTLTNLKKYTTYTISVAVKNTNYTGPASATKQQKTKEDVPEVGPQITEAMKVNVSTFQLSWQPLNIKQSNGLIIKYEIMWERETTRPDSKPSCSYASTAATQKSTYVIPDLKLNEKYIVRVRGHTSAGPGPNSTVSFLTNTSTIKTSTSSLCTTEGSPLTLGCLSSNEQTSAVRYIWTKNGVVVDSAVNKEENKLKIDKVNDKDFATYVCNATNSEATITFTTTIFEVKPCSNIKVAPTSATKAISYILPVVIFVIAIVIIAYLCFRLRKAKRVGEPRRMEQVRDNPVPVEEGGENVIQEPRFDDMARPFTAPKQLPSDQSHTQGHYAEIPANQNVNFVYQSLDDAAREAQEQGGRGDYMELKPVAQKQYESLHHGNQGQAPQQGYNSQA